MAYSDAQKEATARYNKKAYDFISVVVPKGKRKRIAEYAASQGKSMNRFINDAIDAQLRAGGDVRYVMVVTLTAVWLIRLPLTYLFCFVWDWGVLGIYLANTISLYYRAILGLVRHGGQRWMTRRV